MSRVSAFSQVDGPWATEVAATGASAGPPQSGESAAGVAAQGRCVFFSPWGIRQPLFSLGGTPQVEGELVCEGGKWGFGVVVWTWF